MDGTLRGTGRLNQPPALPIKQRRSTHSSSSPDRDADLGIFSPSGTPLPSDSPFSDVFSSTVDCNATQCPIHRHFDYHQGRFFSDQTPPPVPKKRLTRTASLPAWSTRPPPAHPKSPQGYENPLCTRSQTHVSPMQVGEEEDARKKGWSKASLEQLRFDAPDVEPLDFSLSLWNQGEVYEGIQQRFLSLLRSVTQRLERDSCPQDQDEEETRMLQPQDLLLCEDFEPKCVDQDTFYVVKCPKIHGRMFSAKLQTISIHIWQDQAYRAETSDKTSSTSSELAEVVTTCEVNRGSSVVTNPLPLPSHSNIQRLVVHFPRTTAKEMLQGGCEAANPPLEGSTERFDRSLVTTNQEQTVSSLLQQGNAVTVERDFPWATLEDFVQEGLHLHLTQPEVYERRLCVLLLQVTQGLQHLRRHNVSLKPLKPQNIFLVWPLTSSKEQAEKARDDTKSKEREENSGPTQGDDSNGKREGSSRGWEDTARENRKKTTQTLWEKLGAPRVVLTSYPTQADSLQVAGSEEAQLGILIKHCQHVSDATGAPPNTPQTSPYTPGLLHICNLLLGHGGGLRIADAVGVLQALLWGPRAGVFKLNRPEPTVLQNWLQLKRSLLVLKLAEEGLFAKQRVPDQEDYLCLQYLSFTDPEVMLNATGWLGLHHVVN